jgi:uncharacterized membrane protein
MVKAQRGSMIGVIASILIGAAIIVYVVNMLFDTLESTSASEATNETIAKIRPIASAAVVMTAILSIVVVAAQMMGYIGGAFGGY